MTRLWAFMWDEEPSSKAELVMRVVFLVIVIIVWAIVVAIVVSVSAVLAAITVSQFPKAAQWLLEAFDAPPDSTKKLRRWLTRQWHEYRLGLVIFVCLSVIPTVLATAGGAVDLVNDIVNVDPTAWNPFGIQYTM